LSFGDLFSFSFSFFCEENIYKRVLCLRHISYELQLMLCCTCYILYMYACLQSENTAMMLAVEIGANADIVKLLAVNGVD
jgi:hypothetical protein